VSDALGGLKKLIGTNAKLEVQGIPDLSVVKKIYDHNGNVAHLHDLRYSNLVQCVIEMEVRAFRGSVISILSYGEPFSLILFVQVTATGSFPQTDQAKVVFRLVIGDHQI
jgi:hypothetical protein